MIVDKLSHTFFSGLLAVSLHAVLGVLLLFQVDNTLQMAAVSAQPKPPKPIVEAIAINETELKQEMARLDNLEKQKQENEKQRQLALQKEKERIIAERKKEEQRIQKLKDEQAKLQKQKAQKEKERLAKEKEASEALAKQQSAIEKLRQEKAQLEADKRKIEAAKREAELEKQKIEAARKKAQQERDKELAAKKQEEERVAKERAARMLQTKISRHAMIIANKVMQNWRQPLGIDFHGFKCILSVRLSANGEVLQAFVVQSSGNVEFDRSSELAVRKASPLPLPDDKDVVDKFMEFNFIFDPEDA